MVIIKKNPEFKQLTKLPPLFFGVAKYYGEEYIVTTDEKSRYRVVLPNGKLDAIWGAAGDNWSDIRPIVEVVA